MNLPPEELVMARIRGLLLTESRAGTAVEGLAEAIKKSIPGSIGAGVSLMNAQGGRRSTGYTDDVVAAADALQYELGQGPCLTAWAGSSTVQIDDVRTETRWAMWCAAVADLPIRSVLSTALIYDGVAIGALKVYSPLPNAFTERDRRQLGLLATPAATLLGNAQPDKAPAELSRTLQAALHSRDTIHTARGIVMERRGVGPDEAMRRMLDAAMHYGSDLRTVAQNLVDGSADLPR